jgi:hypothetical protein
MSDLRPAVDIGPPRAALPFELSRSNQVIGAEYRMITETIRGLIVLHDGQIAVQWRRERQTERYGAEVRSDRELEAVRATVVPLGALATVRVERRRWRRSMDLVITASDLAAFDALAGQEGLQLAHPGELRLPVAPSARGQADEFASELALAIAQLALTRVEASASTLPRETRDTAIDSAG